MEKKEEPETNQQSVSVHPREKSTKSTSLAVYSAKTSCLCDKHDYVPFLATKEEEAKELTSDNKYINWKKPMKENNPNTPSALAM